MPRGGKRAGAGRKPYLVLGQGRPDRTAAYKLPPAITPEERANLLEPPDDLTPAEQKAWRELAPLALERDTLTHLTAPGFKELCSRRAQVEALDRMNVSNVMDCLSILRERRGWGTLLASSLRDYMLSSFGKPATNGQQKPKDNPFAEIFGVAK